MDISRPIYRHLARARIFCLAAYIIAVFVAIGVGNLFRDLHPLYTVLLADIAGTVVIFLIGRVFRNASFYDPYWSVAPIVIAIFWFIAYPSSGSMALRHIFVILFVFVWGFRLTFNWLRRWRGFAHEDWRYEDLRAKTGHWFWLVELIGIELMPTVLVFLGCLSLYPALVTGSHTFGVIDIIAIVLTASAILIEAFADEQLRSFMKNGPATGDVLTKGLWGRSRHPNYLGEVLFWWGLYFFGLAADARYWWMIIGPIAITILFTTISIPMMEKRNMARRTGYEEFRKKIPLFIPWFRGNK
jgi:steroid 5-alpha reductase family enzyme